MCELSARPEKSVPGSHPDTATFDRLARAVDASDLVDFWNNPARAVPEWHRLPQ